MNKIILNLLFLIGLIENNCFGAAKKSEDTSLSSSGFAKASPDTSVFATASAIAQPDRQSLNQDAGATAWKALPDRSSISSVKSESMQEMTSSKEKIELEEPYSIWVDPTKTKLTSFQKQALEQLRTTGLLESLLDLTASYTEKFSKDATKELLDALKDPKLNDEIRRERIEKAIAQNADVNNQENPMNFKDSPLFYAMKLAELDIAKILIENGAQVNASYVTPNGKIVVTPLSLLDEEADNPFIELLFAKGANPNPINEIVNGREKSLLLVEIEKMKNYPTNSFTPNFVKLLLRKGAKLTEYDYEILQKDPALQKIYQSLTKESSPSSSSSSSSSKVHSSS